MILRSIWTRWRSFKTTTAIVMVHLDAEDEACCQLVTDVKQPDDSPQVRVYILKTSKVCVG